jgi:hypothetical protein
VGLAFPSISASGNNVYVVWHEFIAGTSGFFYMRSTDSGANFEPVVSVGGGSFLRIAATGNNVYMVWNSGTFTPPS